MSADAAARRVPIAVLASGTGTNLQALIDAAAQPGYAAEIALVISDRDHIPALDRARDAGIPTVVVAWADFDSREEFTEALCVEAEAAGARLLVLAGFMRLLAPVAMSRYPHRILNTHPSLLPAFPGAHAIEEALAHGVKVTGMTIHIVDEEMDEGPIVYQEALEIGQGETMASLRERIQAMEHRAYPRVVDAFARGQVVLKGRTTLWRDPP